MPLPRGVPTLALWCFYCTGINRDEICTSQPNSWRYPQESNKPDGRRERCCARQHGTTEYTSPDSFYINLPKKKCVVNNKLDEDYLRRWATSKHIVLFVWRHGSEKTSPQTSYRHDICQMLWLWTAAGRLCSAACDADLWSSCVILQGEHVWLMDLSKGKSWYSIHREKKAS